jgi:Family of unknown function (DUF5990)
LDLLGSVASLLFCTPSANTDIFEFQVMISYIPAMEQELKLVIILESPPPGVDFGLQKGSGNDYETIQTQRSKSGDLRFEFEVRVREGKDGQPNFLGPFAQGSAHERFVYLDIGTYAGQEDTPWSRRLKVPLRSITWDQIKKGKVLETRVPGTGRDGGPSCATVKPFAGWR